MQEQQEFSFEDEFTSPDFDVDFSLDDFDFVESPDGEDDSIHNRYIRPRIYKRSKMSKVNFVNAKQLAMETRLRPNDRIEALVSGNFIFGDFIEAYFVWNQVHTERLVISTLSLSQENIDSIKTLMVKGYVDKVELIVSHYFYSMERKNLMPYMYKELDFDNRFQCAVAFSHTKVAMAKLSTGQHLVMNGSANLRSSNNIEVMTIEDNKEIFDFHMSYHEPILEKYATIQKHETRANLWELIQDKR